MRTDVWVSPSRTAVRVAGAALLCAAGLWAWSGPAYGGTSTPLHQVVVQPGDSLWTIAARDFGDDPRNRVLEIEKINGLSGPGLVAGQRLLVPSA